MVYRRAAKTYSGVQVKEAAEAKAKEVVKKAVAKITHRTANYRLRPLRHMHPGEALPLCDL